MFVSWWLLLAACNSSVPTEIKTAYANTPEKIDFNFHVKPILSDRCYACHGPDDNAREANFRLDKKTHAFDSLSNSTGFAIVAKRPMESELIHRILSEEKDYQMPPPSSEMHLTEGEKAILYKWIEQGAEWKNHWAFIPPQKATIPNSFVNQNQNEIEYFIQKKQKELGLRASNPASKEQWLRRVTFDITGLPPSLQDQEDFLKDDANEAFEMVVDRLLQSPAYGERMATVWLDVARYADSHGYQDDRPRTSWPWRDWVIKAFNKNLSYQDFATWQIAGDLLPNATYEQKLATGFNRNHAITQEGGVVQEEYLTEYAADRTQTFSTAFLGLTMECARCHTHKYDPITQKEYYSLFGFFNNISEKGQISYFDLAPVPNMPMEDSLFEAEISKINNWINALEEEAKAIEKNPVPEFEEWKKVFSINDLPADLNQDKIADFSLNNFSKGQFYSTIPNQPNGLMNINLPPNIDRPELVAGKNGEALAFNGANFLSLGEIGDFEWYDDFSFGGWIQHSGQHEKEAGIFARRVGEQKRQGYELVLTKSNRLQARLIAEYSKKNSWRNALNFAIDVHSKTSITPYQWHHVFVTYNGSGKANGLNLYINGALQPRRIVMDSLRNRTILNGNDFLVGNWNHRARETEDLYGFKGGKVDHVVVYNRALSPVEVQLLANQTNNPNDQALYQHYLNTDSPKYHRLQNELDSLRRIDTSKPSIMIMEEEDTIKTTYVLERGAYDAQTEQVERTTPEAILTFSSEYPSNRLGLAQWLFNEQHPLTTRVIVNRFWQLFFGRGLVNTPEDFGNQGTLPTHPELLDWLAVDFQEQGWDMKKLVKKIVLSTTYRQDATLNKNSLEKDPDNRWLTRGPSQRLTAEMLRDQALVASNLYYQKIGGKWVKPYQPKGIWKELANQIGENKYRTSQGQDLYRRSLYGYWKRTIPPPSMLTFDASERAVCTVKRQQTSTPLQSLVLLNNPLYIEAARALGEDVMAQFDAPKEQIQKAFESILTRVLSSKEQNMLLDIYQKEQERFGENEIEAVQLLQVGNSPVHSSLSKEQLAALTVVINAIFNLDEAKYK